MTRAGRPTSARTLLALARQALEAAVRRAPRPAAIGHGVFDQRAGAFVTLRCGRRPSRLRRSGRAAAPRRRRRALRRRRGAGGSAIPAGERRELAGIHIELSVLGPLTPLDDPSALEPGRHGLVIRLAGRARAAAAASGDRVGVDRDEFLRQTCLKAGLAADAWREGAQLFTFEAEIFGEPDS